MSTILASIQHFLKENDVRFREVHHEPTFTSEESARARGEELRYGGKSLVLKVDNEFKLFVISAALKLDSAKIREHFGTHQTRFATKEELFTLTTLVPGCIPPFGHPILPFELYLDSSIPKNERIAFNAGSLTDSIIISVHDYLRIAKPKECFLFADTNI